jgi:hypothetical protein
LCPFAGYESDAYYDQTQQEGVGQDYYTDNGYESTGNGTWEQQAGYADENANYSSGYDTGRSESVDTLSLCQVFLQTGEPHQMTADGWMTLQDEYGQTYYYNQHTGSASLFGLLISALFSRLLWWFTGVSSWTAPGAEEYSAISDGSSFYPDVAATDTVPADAADSGMVSPSKPTMALTVDTSTPSDPDNQQLITQTHATQPDNPYCTSMAHEWWTCCGFVSSTAVAFICRPVGHRV